MKWHELLLHAWNFWESTDFKPGKSGLVDFLLGKSKYGKVLLYLETNRSNWPQTSIPILTSISILTGYFSRHTDPCVLTRAYWPRASWPVHTVICILHSDPCRPAETITIRSKLTYWQTLKDLRNSIATTPHRYRWWSPYAGENDRQCERRCLLNLWSSDSRTWNLAIYEVTRGQPQHPL